MAALFQRAALSLERGVFCANLTPCKVVFGLFAAEFWRKAQARLLCSLYRIWASCKGFGFARGMRAELSFVVFLRVAGMEI